VGTRKHEGQCLRFGGIVKMRGDLVEQQVEFVELQSLNTGWFDTLKTCDHRRLDRCRKVMMVPHDI
jgi:hypothetical protein